LVPFFLLLDLKPFLYTKLALVQRVSGRLFLTAEGHASAAGLGNADVDYARSRDYNHVTLSKVLESATRQAQRARQSSSEPK
jgi:hypothetical protein